MTDAFTPAIVFLGLISIMLSISVGVRFARIRMGTLSSALSWQLFGEAVIGGGALLFALAAWKGWLPNWDMGIQSALRFVMFAATFATTLYLYNVVRKLN